MAASFSRGARFLGLSQPIRWRRGKPFSFTKKWKKKRPKSHEFVQGAFLYLLVQKEGRVPDEKIR